MRRKTSTVPTKVFKYGLLSPTSNGRLVDEAVYLGHRFYNRLIEIERDRRAEYRAERTLCFPALAAVEKVVADREVLLEKARVAITSVKIAGHTRTVDVEGASEVKRLQAELKELREKLRLERAACISPAEKVVLEKLRALKKDSSALALETKKKLAAELKLAKGQTSFGRFCIRLDDAANEKVKETRNSCGVAWGTYNLIATSVQQASSSASTDPEFRHYTGEGRIGVQIQGGMSVADLAASTQLQIAMPELHEGLTRGQWRRASRTVVKMRVGSDAGRGPIWAEFPAVIHRPLPDDARIMSAVITRRRLGVFRRWCYELCITCESSKFDRALPGPSQEGTAAINFGWRQFPDGLRVATVNSEVSGIEEIRLPNKIVDRFKKCDDLRSIIDQHFNTARSVLTGWLALHRDDCPEWLTTSLEYLHAWKQPERLDRVVGNWAGLRFAADADVYPMLAEWRTKWRHLQEWQMRNRRRGLNMREDFYRTTAARIAQHSARLTIEAFDIRDVAILPKPEEEKTGGSAARHNRFLAAIGQLRDRLLQAAQKYHCAVDIVEPTNNTRRCNVCGKLLVWDPAKKVERDCPDCSTWDQDVNATDNVATRVASGEVVEMVVPAAIKDDGEIEPATRRTYETAREELANLA
jgi:phage FluMu protein Com